MKLGKKVTVFSKETIRLGGDPYMVRWMLLDSPWFGVYLHHILRSDAERWCHDHPFSFVSIMLLGSYAEMRKIAFRLYGGGIMIRVDTVLRKRRAPSIAFRLAEDAHRLILDRPCWTLVLRGPRRREWGFYTYKGWVPHDKYLGAGETK